jgi:tight adherence protein B
LTARRSRPLAALATSSEVRARVVLLAAGGAPDVARWAIARRIDPWLVRHVVDLELPGLTETETVRRLVVPVRRMASFGVALVLVALGPVAVVLLASAVVALDLAARRTAPARRTAAAERQLPFVLESVARRLRAGGSLAQALADAAPARPPELQASWAALVRRIPVEGVEASLDAWAGGWGLRSVRLAAAALALAASTGGSPARAIDGVAATLRARLALADEIRALSSQARASAVVIAASPLVFGAAAAATDDRTGAFLRTPLGVALVTAGLLLDLAGWRWMSRLCRPPVPVR